MSRRKGRETALKLLFQRDLTGTSAEEAQELFWLSNQAPPEARKFADALYSYVMEHQDEIDDLISGHSRNWKLERMSAVDRNTLRLAIAEFINENSPRAVVTDEAVQIAGKFGTEKSGSFVNGILDAILEELERRNK